MTNAPKVKGILIQVDGAVTIIAHHLKSVFNAAGFKTQLTINNGLQESSPHAFLTFKDTRPTVAQIENALQKTIEEKETEKAKENIKNIDDPFEGATVTAFLENGKTITYNLEQTIEAIVRHSLNEVTDNNALPAEDQVQIEAAQKHFDQFNL